MHASMTPDTTNLLPVQYSTTATEINIAVIIGLLKAVIIITIMYYDPKPKAPNYFFRPT